MAYEELKAANARRKGMSEADAAKESMKAPKGDGLVDMKRTKKERKAEMKVSQPYEGESYPYGLRIDFNEEMMGKLGMDLPEVGDEVTITAKGTVEKAEQRDTGEGKKNSCCVQIKRMKVS